MNVRALVLLSFLFLTSCSRREREVIVPDDVLSREEMIAVMTDMHIVEGAKMGRNMMGDTLKVDVYFAKVYEKHQTSESEFDRSFSFYSKYPGTMDAIYEQVIENLNSLEIAAPRWEDGSDTLSSENTDTSGVN